MYSWWTNKNKVSDVVMFVARKDDLADPMFLCVGVVFPYQPHHGRYQLNFHDAKKACGGQDAMMASFEQLFRAWEEGLDWCNAGWIMDGTVQYPITLPREPCGGKDIAPGLRSYGERHKHLHKYDVFCFSSALKGKMKKYHIGK